MKARTLITLIIAASLMVYTQAQAVDLISDGGDGTGGDIIGTASIDASVPGQISIDFALTAAPITIDYATVPPTRLNNLSITGAHIHIAPYNSDTPPVPDWGKAVNKNDCPRQGKFDYSLSDKSDPKIDLSAIPKLTITGLDPGDYAVAIHLEISGVLQVDLLADENWADVDPQPEDTSETAWAFGDEFGCSNWAMFIPDVTVIGAGAPPRQNSTLATRWAALKAE